MSPNDPDPPAAPDHILPIGDRQLERIQPDGSLVVRVQPVDGGAPVESRVVDLSLHGLLLESIPSLAQGALLDLIDLEPQPVRASVVRQSRLGTHVSFIDHLHPRYTRARGEPNRRRHPRVACESPVNVDEAVGTVLNASLGGVLVRVAPGQWSVGDRLKVAIDAHAGPLAGEIVAMADDRLSIRFTQAQPQLRIAIADCVITLEQRGATASAGAPRKRAKAKPATRKPGKSKAAAGPKPRTRAKAKPKPKPKAKTKRAPKAKAKAKPKARAKRRKR
jgi:hypothetical protein